MFFLRDLPSKRMIEGYAYALDGNCDVIAEGLVVMRRASVMIRRLDAHFAELGLSQLRFLFLIVIDREPDRSELSVGEITERLDVAGPVVARTLKTLLGDGLVAIAKNDKDARTKFVCLTDLGRERLAALLPGYFAIISEEMGKTI